MKLKIKYTKEFIPYDRDELIEKLKTHMSKKRVQHVIRVEQKALSMVEGTDMNLEKVSIAALMHDYAKERPDDECRDVIISENMDLEMLQYGTSIWHGPVGAVLARKECRLEDPEILSAIAKHTIGDRIMSPLDKVIFVADYIESGRQFNGVEKARKLAEKDIDKAIKYKLQKTLSHLLAKEHLIYPKAVEVYNAWVPQKQEENND